mgnify:CR=1 FL=1
MIIPLSLGLLSHSLEEPLKLTLKGRPTELIRDFAGHAAMSLTPAMRDLLSPWTIGTIETKDVSLRNR